MKYPPNNRWTSTGTGDINGTFWSSFNIDFAAKPGFVKVTPRTKTTTDDITNLGVAVGFVRFNHSGTTNGFFTVAGDRVFVTSSVDPSAAFADAAAGSVDHSTDTADVIFFRAGNRFCASTQDNVSSNNGSAWGEVAAFSLTSGSVHMLCEYGSRLYVTEEYKKIWSFDSSMASTTSGSYTLSLGTYSSSNVGLFITDIISDRSGIWILTSSQQYGEKAVIHKWDGQQSSGPNSSYVLDCGGALAGVVIRDSLYIMTVEGQLQNFNGGTFLNVDNGRLPISRNKFLKNSFSSVNDRWIHPNGMILTEDSKINILISNEYEDGTIEENMPSGIWEFDLKDTARGWYHKHAVSLYSTTVTDYGQTRVSRVGGLAYMKTPNKNGTFLAGAQVYSDASTTKEIIFTNNTADDVQKYGYIVTAKIFTPNLTQAWTKLSPRFRKLLVSTDSVTAKFRTDDPDPTEISLTWASTSTFTTTTDLSSYVGYEVEVIQGTGSGKCAHISSVTGSGTYTVTLDDTFSGVTGTAKARVQKWTKIGTVTNDTAVQVKEWGFDAKSSPWVQFKICMQLTGRGELYDILIANSVHDKE